MSENSDSTTQELSLNYGTVKLDKMHAKLTQRGKRTQGINRAFGSLVGDIDETITVNIMLQ